MTFTIPDHELIARIGQGSYGEVWLAKSATGRFRAVKVIFRERFKTSQPFDRELSGIRQFEPISRTHEGLVDILHVGENSEAGYFYYVMEAADDRNRGQDFDPIGYAPSTLSFKLEGKIRLSPHDCVELGVSLGRALAHLHDAGLVHRDIKPSNIIFVNGSPKLADIGLVTSIANANSYVGTEGFIPPEGPGSKQADIFSLGKVLYEAATGRDRQQFPDLPTQLDETEAEDSFLELNAVILKACHPDPSERYRDARAMQKDLAALEGGQSVRRLQLLERRFKQFKRGLLATTGVAILIALIALPIIRDRKLVREMHQREQGAFIANATRDLNEGNLVASLPNFVAALRLETGNPRREQAHRLRIASILAYSPKLTELQFAGGELSSVEFSADGNSLVAVEWYSQVRLYEIGAGQKEIKLAVSRPMDASFSPDGRFILTADWGGAARVFDAKTGETNAVFQHPRPLESARYSHDGLRIVTASDDKIARIWDARTGTIVRELSGHNGIVFFAAFSPDDSMIVTTSADHTAQIWDATTGEKIGPALAHQRWVMHAAFSPDNLRIVTACQANTAHLWEARTGRQISFPMEHTDRVSKAIFSPDGSLIATAGLDGFIRLWDGQSGQPLKQHHALKHSSRVEGVAFSRDGRRLASCCLDGSMRIWDFAIDGIDSTPIFAAISEDGGMIAVPSGRELLIGSFSEYGKLAKKIDCLAPISEAVLTDKGRFVLVLTKGPTNQISIWDTEELKRVSPIMSAGGETNLSNFRLSPDGRYLAKVLGMGLALVDVQTGDSLAQPFDHDRKYNLVAFDSVGATLVCASGNTLAAWNLRGKKFVFAPTNFPTLIGSLSFSPDDHRILVGLWNSSYSACAAHLLDAQTGKPVAPPFRHHDGIRCSTYGADGTLFATGGEDFVAMVWRPEDTKPISRMQHGDQIRSLRFNRPGTVLCTWSADRKLRLWDPESGEPLSPPISQFGPVARLIALPDSDAFLAATNASAGVLWRPRIDRRPLEDLESIAQLLSNNWPFETELSTHHIKAAWNRLRELYPDSFAVKEDRILAWHGVQIRQARERKDTASVRFHERILGKLQSGNEQAKRTHYQAPSADKQAAASTD